jgi:hypothetical protein
MFLESKRVKKHMNAQKAQAYMYLGTNTESAGEIAGETFSAAA